MKKLLLIAALLVSGQAFAAMQIRTCTIGPPPASVSTAASATAPITAAPTAMGWVANHSDGAGPYCRQLSKIVATAFVNTTADGGKTYVWTLISTALASTTPPMPVAGTATISWLPTTKDVTGATISIPVTYNLWRGPSNAMVKTVSGIKSPYVDTTVVSGSNYCWGVSAADANGESPSSPPICLTIGAPPAANLPATPTSVTAK
jgi:hypothetical protein